MRILLDKTGTAYELITKGDGKVELRCQHFPEISHVYKTSFIESAIQAGLLTPLSEEPKFTQMKLKMTGA